MNLLSLLMWVVQFGLSAIVPFCALLILAVWLQSKFALGIWIVVVLGIVGLLTSIQTARSCWRSMRKEAEKFSGKKQPPISFNDHD